MSRRRRHDWGRKERQREDVEEGSAAVGIRRIFDFFVGRCTPKEFGNSGRPEVGSWKSETGSRKSEVEAKCVSEEEEVGTRETIRQAQHRAATTMRVEREGTVITRPEDCLNPMARSGGQQVAKQCIGQS